MDTKGRGVFMEGEEGENLNVVRERAVDAAHKTAKKPHIGPHP